MSNGRGFGRDEDRLNDSRIVSLVETADAAGAVKLPPEFDVPDVLIEIRKGWIGSQGSRLLDAVHAAIVEALRTPEDDKVVRLAEHPPEHFAIPQRAGERFTHIEITMFAGRTLATKRALYQAIVRNLEPFGIPPNDVKVILIEVSAENVGMRGGAAACDLDIGYAIRV